MLDNSDTKPPIILVHGFRGAPKGLEEVAKILENAGYRVFVPAIPPFASANLPASSSEESRKYTPESYNAFLKSYILKNKLRKPILIGHSMGSIIVAAFSQGYPELINDKVFLLSPISKTPNLFMRFISPLSAFLPRRVVDYVTTKFLFVPQDPELFRKTLEITHVCSSDHPPRLRNTLSAARFSANHSVAELLVNESSQTSRNQTFIFIAGEKDRLIKKSDTEKLVEKVGSVGAKTHLTFISNSGHLHNYEAPEETAELILKFLNTKS